MKARAPKVVGNDEKTKKLMRAVAARLADAEVTVKRSIFHLMTKHNKTEEQARKLLGLPLQPPTK